MNSKEKFLGLRSTKFAILTVVLLAVTFAVTFLLSTGRFSGNASGSDYKAVFLNNANQVYFGRVISMDGGFLRLENVYYPKTPKIMQPDYSLSAVGQEGDGDVLAEEVNLENPLRRSLNPAASRPYGDLQLIKLGEEVYGPADVMTIPMSSINFIVDIDQDSGFFNAAGI